jgi:hypothetical protein
VRVPSQQIHRRDRALERRARRTRPVGVAHEWKQRIGVAVAVPTQLRARRRTVDAATARARRHGRLARIPVAADAARRRSAHELPRGERCRNADQCRGQNSIVIARRITDTMFRMTLKSALMAIVLFLCLLAGQFSVARAGALEDGLAYLQVRWIAMIAS